MRIINPGKGLTLFEALKSPSLLLKASLRIQTLTEERFLQIRSKKEVSKVIEIISKCFIFKLVKNIEVVHVSEDMECVCIRTFIKFPFIKIKQTGKKYIRIRKNNILG